MGHNKSTFWRKLAALIAFILFLTLGLARSEDAINGRLSKRIKQAMDESKLPSLSIAIGRNRKIIFSAAQGLSDEENSVPVTAQSVYRIGSISKTITATAILQLAERGKINLDAPVQDYCPAFPVKEYPVTSRQLLSHLGGIRDYNYQRFEEEFLSAKRYASIADSLVIFKNDPLIAPPGTKYQYSSFGFVLLGCVVEGASKQTYGQYIKEAIFDVAGMASSRLDVPEDVIAHRVRGYSKTKDRTIRNSPYVDLSDRYPAGGILSTPEDLVRFAMNLLDRKLLKKETTDSMWTEQNTASGQPTKYGLGWRISSQPLEIFHGGSSVGASSYLYIQPETGIVVAFATNLDRWDEPRHKLAQDLAAIAAAMKLPED